ncbi:site-specific integrase [Limnohabitans sp. Rim8]|uniref:site-specific integrase n=1 Tax=Limnohabitans sp. Rim8 TaxID=1100718 RepID=UPI0025CE5B25|nr:site-specific integrase [Limnohabitans sp. Rim8]
MCPPDRAHIEVFDPDLRGFYVDVLASGRKSFRLRYSFNKKLRIVTLGNASVMSLDDARQAARAWLLKAKLGEDPLALPSDVLGPTVASFFSDQYLPYIKTYKRSWVTDDSMMRNHLLPALGHKHMGAISAPDVAVFVNQMRTQGFAPGTCNRALVLLRYGFALALRWKVAGIESNPVKEVKNLRDDNKLERFLTNEQMASLMAAVRESDSGMLQHIVLFLLYTGARKREVLDATWADVDWERKSWRIPKTKSGKIRHIPLSAGALQLLGTLQDMTQQLGGMNSVVKGQLATRHIFANPQTGVPFRSFYYSWDSARKRAGLPDLRVHDLRHSFASFLVNAGRSLYEVQELLGHADIRTTSRYAHLSRDRLLEAVEAVPNL